MPLSLRCRRPLPLLAIFLCLASSAPSLRAQADAPKADTPKFEDLAAQYDYSKQTSLDFTEVGVEMRGNVMIIDLLYKGSAEVRVPAYLVIPKGDGPFAAILWGHWLMPGSPLRNRDQFLDEAVVLARAGAVSLLIDLPQARPDFVPKDVKEAPLEWAIQQSDASRQAVIDFRRGLGLLRNRHVDPKRIAYVGHSFGAHVGAILAGVDNRIENFVLMAGNFTDEEFVRKSTRPEVVQWRKQMGDEHMDTYFHEYAWDDPVHFINHTDSDSILLQFARGDGVTPAEAQRQLGLFSAKDKESKIYDATHALNSAARLDRVRWLQRRLKLKTVDEKALEAIAPLK